MGFHRPPEALQSELLGFPTGAHDVLVDAFCIAGGFILRVIAGGYAAETPVSYWLILCTLFLSLFLALCKRHAEIDLLGEDRGSHRKILTEYSPQLLDQLVTMVAACTILSYALYTVAEDGGLRYSPSGRLVWTVPFVVFGLFRYLLLAAQQRGGGSPTKVLLGGDAAFLVNGLAWLTVILMLLFGGF